jgi:hypothetical protein
MFALSYNLKNFVEESLEKAPYRQSKQVVAGVGCCPAA